VEGEPDAAGEFREHGDVFVGVVDALERVERRIVEIAGGHLRMFGAGVEEGRRGRHVIERCYEAIKLDGFVWGSGEAAGDAQKEVLRALDDAARDGIAEEIAIVDGAETEVFEEVGDAVVDGVV
jgi:hypothetical protein